MQIEKKTITKKSLFLLGLIFITTLNFNQLKAQLITYSFNTGGATGQNGPSQLQINTAYALTNLNGSVTVNGGIQSFTVPANGPYRIVAAGAAGGSPNAFGGRGRVVQGDIILTQGTVLQILVGQKGDQVDQSTSGGGGSYVVDALNTPIIIGGGGAGFHLNYGVNSPEPLSDGNYGQAGQNSNDGTGFGGAPGDGGQGTNDGWGGGGGGFNTDGTDASYCNPTAGSSFLNGGTGGNTCNNTVGGFGGGAGTHGNTGGGGGGGGYSGGGGSTQNNNNATGGGGGSYQAPGMTNLVDGGLNLNEGYVTITKLYGVSISQTGLLTCFGQSVAALTGSVGGGVAPYTYTWLPTGGNTSVAVNLGAGVYTCAVTDANNEVTETSFTITQPALLTSSITNSGSVTCNGGVNGTASVSVGGGIPNYLYNWVPSGGFSPVAFGLTGGSYTVYVVDANGCQTSKSITINQPAFPLSVNASSAQICAGSGVSLLASGATNYTWTGGITNGVIFSPTTTASYTVTGTNTLSGCSNSLAITVTVYPKPTITTSGAGTICPGQIIGLGANGAFTYTWSPVNTNGFFINVSPTVTTTYSVNGTSANGCLSSNTATAQIFVTNQNCVGIEELSNSLNGLLIYPNPTSGDLTFELNNGLVKTVELIDLMGRVVLFNQSLDDKINLDLSNLSNGIYSAKIKSDNSFKVIKVVKQ